MSSTDEITIKYQFTISDNKGQGLIFGMPDFNVLGNPETIDGISFEDIFNSIAGDTSLKTIMENRPDTKEGAQQILIAQSKGDLEEREKRVDLLNKAAKQGEIDKLEDAFTSKLDDALNNPKFDGILDKSQLPDVSDDIFDKRLSQLIEYYNVLVDKINLNNLFTMGKFDVKVSSLKKFNETDFKDKNKKISLVAFLFYVAKTFMRIPIVLLTASTTVKELEDYSGNVTEKSTGTYQNRIGTYNTLKSHIYPSEIKTNKKLIESIGKNRYAQITYNYFITSEIDISIDMLCLLLINLVSNTNENYDYFIIAFCERMIYILKYWCSGSLDPSTNADDKSKDKSTDAKPKDKSDNKDTSKLTTSSSYKSTDRKSCRLGDLHFTQINVILKVEEKTTKEGNQMLTADNKNRNFASILQKIHNTNDNLVTFVKVRKGRTTIDPSDLEYKKTENDNKTMNIRYSGISDDNNRTIQTEDITKDRKILEFRYDDNIKSFYKDCDRVDPKGDPITIYKKFNQICSEPKGETGYVTTISGELLAKEVNYKHDFNLGPFTHIFDENDQNKDIAESSIFKEKILNKLKEGSPVSIIGYGASGSGKTSVLIQLAAPNQEVQPGILMYLSDALGEEGSVNCDVQIIEFGKISMENPGDAEERAFVGSYKYENKKWVITGYKDENGTLQNDNVFFMKKEICTYGDMFKDILLFMEFQRIVRKTPNNPVSSRTHVIISLKYYKDNINEAKKLFICDLAGVENAFECGNITEDATGKEKFQTKSKPRPVENCGPPVEFSGSQDNSSEQQDISRGSQDISSRPQGNARGTQGNARGQQGESNNKISFYGNPMKFNNNFTYIPDPPESLLDYYQSYMEGYRNDNMNFIQKIKIANMGNNDFGIKASAEKMENGSFVMRNMKMQLGKYFNTVKTELKTFDKLVEFVYGLNALTINVRNKNVKGLTGTLDKTSCYNYDLKPMDVTTFESITGVRKIDKIYYIFNEEYYKNERNKIFLVQVVTKPELNEMGRKILKTIGAAKNATDLKNIKGSPYSLYALNVYAFGFNFSGNPELQLKSKLIGDGYKEIVPDFTNPKKIGEIYKVIVTNNCTGIPETKLQPITFSINNDGITFNGVNGTKPLIDPLTKQFIEHEVPVALSPDIKIESPQIVIYNNNKYDKTADLINSITDKNTYNVKLTSDVLSDEFNKNKDFVTKYTTFLTNLANSIGIKQPNLYAFVFYLKNKFLNEFEDGYNMFQRQVLLEQLRFYEEDSYTDNNLDKTYQPKTETFDELEKQSKEQKGGGYKEFCDSRTLEGRYINKFLAEMRKGIPKYVATINKRKGMPSFFSKCLPLQCNPEFKDCLGINNYTPIPVSNKNESYGELVDMIKKYVESGKKLEQPPIVFCVFCVLNLSEPPLVKDPPPVPYVDLTKLQQLYQILDNISIEESFRELDPLLKSIQAEMIRIFNSDQYKKQGTNENIRNIVAEVATILSDRDKDRTSKFNIPQFNSQVKAFITFISNVNAATPIGTVLFTDSVAKNFVDVNTCNAYQQLDYADDKFGIERNSLNGVTEGGVEGDGQGFGGGSSNYEYHINDDTKAEPKSTKSGIVKKISKQENTRKTIYNLTNHTGKSRTIRRK
jgi:hypothetical protein